jgi:hypothetical protein
MIVFCSLSVVGCQKSPQESLSSGSIRAVCEMAYLWNIDTSNPNIFRADLIKDKLAENPNIFSTTLKEKLNHVYLLDQQYTKIRNERFGGLNYGNFGLTVMRLNLPLKGWLCRNSKWSEPKINGAFATLRLKDVKTYASGLTSITTPRTLQFFLKREKSFWSIYDVKIQDKVVTTSLNELLTQTLISLEKDI